VSSGEFRSADGRTVVFNRYGSTEGQPVVFHYGTPGTRLISPRMVGVAERLGAQVVVLDRPGYGPSTRWPGRHVADVAVDVAAAVEMLGWERFSVWGGSGGGPHALACAAMLGARVTRCASVVGPAPYDAAGLDWLAGMSAGNVEEFARAREGEDSYRPLVERLARESVEAVEAGHIPIQDQYQLPESDRAALRKRLADPGFLERIVASNRDGVDGWIDDVFAMMSPWGFEVNDITVPVSVWYGPDDVLCPRTHADWLIDHIPGAEGHPLPGGHLVEDDDLEAIYTWLLAE
jgi:pimeloyl-ACP methyl ester carboxylesterase